MTDMRYPPAEKGRLDILPPRYRDVRAGVEKHRRRLRHQKQKACSILLWNDRIGWGLTKNRTLAFVPHESCRVMLYTDSLLDDITATLLLGMQESRSHSDIGVTS